VSRDSLARVDDMIAAAERVMEWTPPDAAEALERDIALRYQIERALEVLGEAAKHVPAEIRSLAPSFPWREACGLRDVLAHAYFDVDPEILANVGLEALPAALPELRRLRDQLAAAV
jgi:uncharacterized protein with HEPN domain